MDKFTGEIAQYLFAHKMVEEDQMEWCQYVLTKYILSTIFMCYLLLIGSFIGSLRCASVFTFSFLFLRKYTNGYHAHTIWGCLAASTLFEVVAMRLIPYYSAFLFGATLLISGICIVILAPVNNQKIHLSQEEMNALQKISKKKTMMLLFFALLLWNFAFFELAVCIALALFSVGVSLALSIAGVGVQ